MLPHTVPHLLQIWAFGIKCSSWSNLFSGPVVGPVVGPVFWIWVWVWVISFLSCLTSALTHLSKLLDHSTLFPCTAVQVNGAVMNANNINRACCYYGLLHDFPIIFWSPETGNRKWKSEILSWNETVCVRDVIHSFSYQIYRCNFFETYIGETIMYMVNFYPLIFVID